MRLGDQIGLVIITAFWMLFDVYLLFNPLVADGLGSYLGVSGAVFEFIVLGVGGAVSIGIGLLADRSDSMAND